MDKCVATVYLCCVFVGRGQVCRDHAGPGGAAGEQGDAAEEPGHHEHHEESESHLHE